MRLAKPGALKRRPRIISNLIVTTYKSWWFYHQPFRMFCPCPRMSDGCVHEVCVISRNVNHSPMMTGYTDVYVFCQMVLNASTVFLGAAMLLRVYGVVNCIWLLMVVLVLFCWYISSYSPIVLAQKYDVLCPWHRQRRETFRRNICRVTTHENVGTKPSWCWYTPRERARKPFPVSPVALCSANVGRNAAFLERAGWWIGRPNGGWGE